MEDILTSRKAKLDAPGEVFRFFNFMATGKNSFISKSKRQQIMLEPCCRYCHTDDADFAVDHILPPMFGGDSSIENLVKACKRCNSSKGKMLLTEWFDHLSAKRHKIFNDVFGYTYRLRTYRSRGSYPEVCEQLVGRIRTSRKEHSRLTRMLQSALSLMPFSDYVFYV